MINVEREAACLNSACRSEGKNTGSASPAKEWEPVMRLFARSAAIGIVSVASFGASAADLDYPPPVVGQPQYSIVPPVAVAPPQAIVVPAPTLSSQYNRAPSPPPPVAPPYGIAPPVPPGVDVGPRAACQPIWRCGGRGCGWQPSCVPPPERYSGPYGPPADVYGSPGPQYAPPPSSPAPVPELYPDPYSRQVYPAPSNPYSQ
jgi:hypothetical protein